MHDLLNSTDPQDCFVTKLDAGGGIAYSTFLGGQNNDRALGIAVDAAGRAYVKGTESRNFPIRAFQSDLGGGTN